VHFPFTRVTGAGKQKTCCIDCQSVWDHELITGSAAVPALPATPNDQQRVARIDSGTLPQLLGTLVTSVLSSVACFSNATALACVIHEKPVGNSCKYGRILSTIEPRGLHRRRGCLATASLVSFATCSLPAHASTGAAHAFVQ
jgi:hypothetical protein